MKKRVLVTGHTGFKGGWLSTWLLNMGAQVSGFSLEPTTQPVFFEVCGLGEKMKSFKGDIRNGALLYETICEQDPEIIFHLAAQAFVRKSYADPLETFSANVMGTVNLLEAVRRSPRVSAVVVVTSDKCYENKEWVWGYREDEAMGGDDPYSASKGCCELVTRSYRQSFFKRGRNLARIATARAGNVMGGGDWGLDRIVPDAIRALSLNKPLIVRNPNAVRPWQHVLDPLAGYLLLAEKLYEDRENRADAWNFGPPGEDAVTVADLVDKVIRAWGTGRWEAVPEALAPRETRFLKLDSSKARQLLGWQSRLNLDQSVELTVDWHRAALNSDSPQTMYELTSEQIRGYQRETEGAKAVVPAESKLRN